MNYKFLKIPVLLLFVCGVLAQQPARIQQDVKYLASDELEGRLTGSKGATEAARYIASEFRKVGLKPLAGSAARQGLASPLYQRFSYVAGVSLGKNNSYLFSYGAGAEGPVKIELVGSDWLPLGFSASANVSAGLVFVGYGITASELNHNDYAGVNATGNIAIALQGTPDGDNPHGQFARFEGV